jgi:hypothetical protein
MTDHQQRFVFAADVILQVIDREALILKLDDEVAFSLNETGARIGQLIAEGRGLDELVDILASEYATPRSELDREVRGLVKTLLGKGLLVVSGTGEGP